MSDEIVLVDFIIIVVYYHLLLLKVFSVFPLTRSRSPRLVLIAHPATNSSKSEPGKLERTCYEVDIKK